MSDEARFDALVNAHTEELFSVVGADASVNLGWASGDDFIATKVYGSEPKVLTTTRMKRGYKHEWEDYRP